MIILGVIHTFYFLYILYMTLKKKLEDKKTITVVYVPYFIEFYTINHIGSNTVYKLP